MQVCKSIEVNNLAKDKEQKAKAVRIPDMSFQRRQHRGRQRGTAARMRFSSQLHRQSNTYNFEVRPAQRRTATCLNNDVFSSPDFTNVTTASGSPSSFAERDPTLPGARKGTSVKLLNRECDCFLNSPHSYTRLSSTQDCDFRNCLSQQDTRSTFAPLTSLGPNTDQQATALSTPATPHSRRYLFSMDFVSTYFSRTPRNNAHAATTPGCLMQNSSKRKGSEYWDEDRKKFVNPSRSEDVQGNDIFSPASSLCQKLGEVRKFNAQQPNDQPPLPEIEAGFMVAARPGSVHFLAPIAEDFDSLQTITLTPKAPTLPVHTPPFETRTVLPQNSTPVDKGFIVRRTSCESTASSGAKKDKRFNLFGFWIPRQNPPP